MMETGHILVVDDEPELRDMVAEYLTRHGFVVSTADGGAAMRAVLAEGRVDLVLLDIRMPVEDGLGLAGRLRQQDEIGIIMLTAECHPIDRVLGLELGADDYIVKPFDPRELLARIRAVLRRRAAETAAAAGDGAAGEVRFGRCVLNLASGRLYAPDGAELPLAPSELDLLRAFAANPNRMLSRDELLDLIGDGEGFDRSVDVRIWRLRRRIEADSSKPEIIKTVRGGGYLFVPGGQPEPQA